VRVYDWNIWLEQHIPYYEADRLRAQYSVDPPQVLLEIDILDRHRRNTTWDDANQLLEKYNAKPVFLSRDTHQKWYWAFWDNRQALIAVIML
jgi:hypothetical protein